MHKYINEPGKRIQGSEVGRHTEQFREKETLKALANLIQEEKTVAGFRRIYMSEASKYMNPERGMMADGGSMTDIKLLVYTRIS